MTNSFKKRERLPRGSGRDLLLNAATELFLEHGFEGTSPQAIYSKSGVGQGSFYHHFTGKDDLANQVLSDLAIAESLKLNVIEKEYSSPIERLNEYLKLGRKGTKGCKFGRFVYESSLQKKELSDPIKRYFDELLNFLVSNIEQAHLESSINIEMPSKIIAQAIISHIQGGYVLSRLYKDDNFLSNNILIIKSWLNLPK